MAKSKTPSSTKVYGLIALAAIISLVMLAPLLRVGIVSTHATMRSLTQEPEKVTVTVTYCRRYAGHRSPGISYCEVQGYTIGIAQYARVYVTNTRQYEIGKDYTMYQYRDGAIEATKDARWARGYFYMMCAFIVATIYTFVIRKVVGKPLSKFTDRQKRKYFLVQGLSLFILVIIVAAYYS